MLSRNKILFNGVWQYSENWYRRYVLLYSSTGVHSNGSTCFLESIICMMVHLDSICSSKEESLDNYSFIHFSSTSYWCMTVNGTVLG